MAAKSELEIIIGLKDNASRALGGLTGHLSNIGKFAGGVALGGIAALGGGLALLASKAIPAASNLTEATNAVNVVFGESSKVITDWAGNAATQAGLAQSAFLQMSAQTGAMLQNLGLDQGAAAEQSVKLAQRAADMASIFNTDVADALGAIQAGLRGEMDPLERFGVRLSQTAVHAKAVEMGLIGAKDQMDDQTRAAASLALFYEQTDKVAGDFANTSGDLANAQRVAKAQMENFLATVGQMALPLLGKFFNLVSTRILPVLNSFAKYIGFVIEEGDELNDFLADLPKWLQPIAKAIAMVIKAFKTFFGALQSGKDFVGTLIGLVQNLGLAFGLSEDEAQGVATTFSNVLNTLIAFKDGLLAFLAPIIQWVQANVSLKDVLIALGIVIAAVVIPAILSLLATIAPIILIFAAIVLAVALLRKAWESNWGGIQDKVNAVIAFVGPLIQNFIASIAAWWAEHGDEIIARAKAIWDGIVKIITKFIAWIGPKISAFIQGIAQWWAEHGEAIKATVKAIWDGIVATFKWFEGIFKGLFQAFRLAREGDWRGFGEKLRQIWDEIWQKIKQIAEGAWNLLKSAFTTLINNAKNIFKNTDWGAVGKSIIQGIANGIANFAYLIIDAARRAARAAFEAAKGFLGIDSPSKKFAELGKNMMQGMAIGLDRNVGAPARAMSSALGAVTPGLSSGGLVGGGDVFIDVGGVFLAAAPGQDGSSLAREFLITISEASRRAAYSGLKHSG